MNRLTLDLLRDIAQQTENLQAALAGDLDDTGYRACVSQMEQDMRHTAMQPVLTDSLSTFAEPLQPEGMVELLKTMRYTNPNMVEIADGLYLWASEEMRFYGDIDPADFDDTSSIPAYCEDEIFA